jgi:hypothetical protein
MPDADGFLTFDELQDAISECTRRLKAISDLRDPEYQHVWNHRVKLLNDLRDLTNRKAANDA